MTLVAPRYVHDAVVVIDCVTGLEWLRTPASAAHFSAAVQACAGSHAGHDDWRLPSIMELMSIVDYGQAGGVLIDSAHFVQPQAGVWTSEQYQGDFCAPYGCHFFVAFGVTGIVPAGSLDFCWDEGCDEQARCVRGPSLTPQFSVNPGPPETVREPTTSLEWQREADAADVGWTAALALCNNLGEGWRLPNVKELATLFNAGKAAPYTYPSFTDGAAQFWSATPASASTAFIVDFTTNDPNVAFAIRAVSNGTSSVRARCVRAMQ